MVRFRLVRIVRVPVDLSIFQSTPSLPPCTLNGLTPEVLAEEVPDVDETLEDDEGFETDEVGA